MLCELYQKRPARRPSAASRPAMERKLNPQTDSAAAPALYHETSNYRARRAARRPRAALEHRKTPILTMAIDSVRLLTDSAAQIWRRLARFSPLEALCASESFDQWIGAAEHAALDAAEEQALRRDYRRLTNLIEEIETLVRSRARALELVQARLSDEELVRSPAA